MTYSYTNSLGKLSYTFHQRGNEFDEYTYEYEKRSENFTTYKNESLLEEYSYSYGNEEKMDDVDEMIIRQYVIPKSYQLDKKNNPVLKTSKFLQKNMCSCEEGYITKIELWSWNKCRSKYVLEQ